MQYMTYVKYNDLNELTDHMMYDFYYPLRYVAYNSIAFIYNNSVFKIKCIINNCCKQKV